VRCECGCGFVGEDDVTQFCVEEAVFERLHLAEAMERSDSAPVDLLGAPDPMQQARDFAQGRS